MSTTLAQPRPVTATATEPEPEHERDTSNPDQMPSLPRRAALAGLFEDMEAEDDDLGPTDGPEGHVVTAGDLLLLQARAADTRRGGWRTPRTAQEMRRKLPLTPVTGRRCPAGRH